MAAGLIDFHNHFVGGLPSQAAAKWPLLADEAALEGSLGALQARVVSTPLEFVPGVPAQRINDSIAALASRHRGVVGLASVDAYGGAPAAQELTRAVKVLGVRGVFVESAKGELLPDCEQAQPLLAAAASLGVPVFLHPVPDLPLRGRFRNERLARGTINAAAILAMIGAGMFEAHRGLKVVVTALALGGLLLADRLPDGVYIDTTGMKPATLRGALELLGPGRVVAGSDWPVVQESDLAQRLSSMLGGFGLPGIDRERVVAGNASELLGI
ncbi:MAG TPA: amidohydrolase family protein [Burkholderiales bacterium]|jgi:aminocarboxymuconate-semialdehyde decarboxylase